MSIHGGRMLLSAPFLRTFAPKKIRWIHICEEWIRVVHIVLSCELGGSWKLNLTGFMKSLRPIPLVKPPGSGLSLIGYCRISTIYTSWDRGASDRGSAKINPSRYRIIWVDNPFWPALNWQRSPIADLKSNLLLASVHPASGNTNKGRISWRLELIYWY